MAYNRDHLNQQYFDLLLNKEILIGYCNRDAYKIPRYARWFNDWYEKQEPEYYVLSKLNPRFLESLEMVVIAATWCGSCRAEIARFYKILDVLEINPGNLSVIYVNKLKQVPGLDLTEYQFTRVPTFIFYRDHKEIGRINEQPKDTLEKDLLDIQQAFEQ